jgi:RHS repeat-associated protein
MMKRSHVDTGPLGFSFKFKKIYHILRKFKVVFNQTCLAISFLLIFSLLPSKSIAKNLASVERDAKKEQTHRKVLQHPIASFTVQQETFLSPFKFKFDASSSHNPDGDRIVLYIWKFGDKTSDDKDKDKDENDEHETKHDEGFLSSLKEKYEEIYNRFFDHSPHISRQPIIEHDYKKAGVYHVKLTVIDSHGKKARITQSVTVKQALPPIANIRLLSAQSGLAPFVAWFDASGSSDPQGFALQYNFDFADGSKVSQSNPKITHEFQNVGTYQVRLTVVSSSGLSSQQVISVQALAPTLPPDPATVAPPIPTDRLTILSEQVQFFTIGPAAQQTGVLAGSIDPNRTAVLKGSVVDQDLNPLAGVRISSVGSPEFGQTQSRADGKFEFVVNSGVSTAVVFKREGYPDVQRQIFPNKSDYYPLDQVLMSRFDSKVSLVLTGSSSSQFVSANPVSDQDGARTASLMIPSQTQAQLVMPDGSTKTISNLSIRATEFTVGANGLRRMPAPLPIHTAYTYAVELSADEARAAGAQSVSFSKPIPFYVDNFLSFPTGSAIPLGSYNRTKAIWEALQDGVVIKILSIVGGSASISVTADEASASQALLDLHGITSEELQSLAANYPQGKSLWRARVSHFSSYDLNPSGKSIAQPLGNEIIGPTINPNAGETPPGPTESLCGCILDLQEGVLREKIALLGTPFSLYYSTQTMTANKSGAQINVTLTGANITSGLQRVRTEVSVAGQSFSYENKNPIASESKIFEWNGLDFMGRPVVTPVTATIKLIYDFTTNYLTAPYNALRIASFDLFPASSATASSSKLRSPDEAVFHFEQSIQAPFYFVKQEKANQLGGWDINVHHYYDPVLKTIYFGNGTSVNAKNMTSTIKTIAGVRSPIDGGDGGPANLAKLKDPVSISFNALGEMFISENGKSKIRKVDLNGIISTVVGTGVAGFSGDGGSALQATIRGPRGITFTRDGSMYFSEAGNHVVRKVSTLGIISTVVGTGGVAGYSGDGGPASAAQLNGPRNTTASPDGSLYISDSGNNVIRRVLPDATIVTFAGTGVQGYSGDGGSALSAQFNNPNFTTQDATGNLYIADTGNHVIRKILTDGTISTVVGTGVAGFSGDEGLASQAQLNSPTQVSVSSSGEIYIADSINNRVRFVSHDGKIHTVVGNGNIFFDREETSPLDSGLREPVVAFIKPDQSLVVIDRLHQLIRRVAPPFEGDLNENIIPSTDGSELFVFDKNGRHLRTLFGRTNQLKWLFQYSADGRLISISDSEQNVTQIVRNSSGQAQSIIGPFGSQIQLGSDSSGFLNTLSLPTGETYHMQYQAGGLMTQFSPPKNNTSTYTYQADGRLIQDLNPGGGSQNLSYTSASGGLTTQLVTGLGRIDQISFNTQGTQTTKQFVNRNGSRSSMFFDSGGQASTLDTSGESTAVKVAKDPRFNSSVEFNNAAQLKTQNGLISTRTESVNYPILSASQFQESRTITVDSKSLTSQYDSVTQVMSTTTGVGRTSQVSIDAHERPVAIQAASFLPVQYTYDSRGRIIQTQQGPRVTKMSYDSRGYLNQIIDPELRVFQFLKDPSGRTLQEVLPDGRIIQMAYDGNSNLIAIKPPGKDFHQMVFGVFDEISQYLSPLVNGIASVFSFSYNQDRQIASETRADNKVLNYSYGTITDQFLGVQSGSDSKSVQYDTAARISQVSSSDGENINYQWDSHLLLSKNYSGVLNANFSQSYTNPGILLSTQGVNGQGVSFAYDADQLLTSAGALILNRNQQSGLISSLALGSVTESLSYSSFGELSSKSVPGYYSAQYTRDHLGRIISINETAGSDIFNWSFVYDLSGRLSSASRNSVINNYAFDSNSNRIGGNIRGQNISASYDAQDRLISYNGATYTFDPQGDLQMKSGSEGVTKYMYSVYGELKHVALPNGSVIDYITDGESHRIAKKINGTMVKGYIYSGSAQIVGETDGSGTLVSQFVYASQSHSPDYMIKNGVNYRMIKDPLGSIRLVVNSGNGSIAQRIDYDEFGVVLADSNPGLQPFAFAGGLYDQDTKLIRFGARDYDPVTGRWLSKDPIGFHGGSTNLYLYTRSDPVNFIDTDGRNPVLIAVGIGAAVGAIANLSGSYAAGTLTYENAVQTALIGAIAGTAAVLTAGTAALATAVTLAEILAADVGSGLVGTLVGTGTDLGLTALTNPPAQTSPGPVTIQKCP